MRQKQKINENKNSLISSTLEKGGTLDSIKTELESYEEQLKGVDEPIAEMITKKRGFTTEFKNPFAAKYLSTTYVSGLANDKKGSFFASLLIMEYNFLFHFTRLSKKRNHSEQTEVCNIS